jgi:hypothetical protein
MPRWLRMVAPVCLLAGTSTAFAQIPNDFIRMFGVSQRASVQAATRSEWSKVSTSEIRCINDALRQRGASVETLTQRGVKPSDPRIGSIRSNCRSQFGQLPSVPTYAVAGLALGSRVQFDTSDYREYKCSPSEQFVEFTWCQKTRQERERRGSTNVTHSILHSRDGTVVYVNRYQEPAVFGPNEVDEAIRRNSIKLGEKAKIEKLPHRPGFPEGTLATWGKVTLEPLDSASINTLAEGRSPKKGYLIDFIGNFTRSAKEGLPIYRISGGAGFLWVESSDQRGRGTLRFAAIDSSAIHPTPLPSEVRSDAQTTSLDPEPPATETANAGAVRQGAERAAEQAKDAEIVRNESEAAKRDAQLAKAETERLSAERIKLNAALEQLETEKTAAEGRAHIMAFVAYGAIIVLIALLAIVSSLLFLNRRRAAAVKRQGIGPETKLSQVTEDSPETERASDSQRSKISDAPPSSPELAQSSTSDATMAKSEDASGVSDTKSAPSSDTAEDHVTMPPEKMHSETKTASVPGS